MRTLSAVVLLTFLAGCQGNTQSRPASPSVVAPPVPSLTKGSGLDRVMGANARSLSTLFGTAQQDVREEGARKLQFANDKCILDAYLYPQVSTREPVVTYLAARLPDGRETDKAGCVTALSRKR